jgi:hypothetical protein
MNKKLLIVTMLSGLLIGSYGFSPADQVTVYAQKKDGGKRKDPVGPPVVRPKGDRQKDSPKKQEPRKDKKPPH